MTMLDAHIYGVYLAVYFALIMVVGVYHAVKIKDADEYLIAGWNVGFWSLVGTTVATACGAAAFIGFVGLGFASGISGIFFWVLPSIFFSLVFVIVFGRTLAQLRLYTIPDVFAVRFGRKAAFIPALFQIFVYSVPTLAIQFIGMGTIFNTFFGVEFQTAVFYGFLVIFAYASLGGLPATISTDTIQAVILIGGLLLLLFFGIHYAGGISRILDITPLHFLDPMGKSTIWGMLSLALTIGPFFMVLQTTWQRIFAAKNEAAAVKGISTGIIITAIILSLSFITGIVARGYLPTDIRPDLVFTQAISTVFPTAVGGLIVVGLTAALMSGGDSFVMMGSASLARDIYQQYFRPQAAGVEMLRVSRICAVVVSLMALGVALLGKGIIPLYLLVVKTAGAGLVFPFLALMLWKGATQKGILSSMIVGGVMTVVWHLVGNPYIVEAGIGYISSFVVLVVVSLMTSHSPDEQIKAAYFERLDTRSYVNRVRRGRAFGLTQSERESS